MRNGCDQGAVVAEFAIVLPILIVLLSGVFDMGWAFHTSRQVQESARTGARIGAAAGEQRLADYAILRSVTTAHANTADDLQGVVVYRSETGSAGLLPAGCEHGSTGVPGTCNVYNREQLTALAETQFTGADCAGSPDAMWCATTRGQAFTNGDLLGVSVSVDHKPLVGFLFPDRTFHKSAVFQIEIADRTPPPRPTPTVTPQPTAICQATFFTGGGQSGSSWVFTPGWSDSPFGIGGESAASVSVAPGCNAQIARFPDGSGPPTCETFSSGSSPVGIAFPANSEAWVWVGSGTPEDCDQVPYAPVESSAQPTPTPTSTPTPTPTSTPTPTPTPVPDNDKDGIPDAVDIDDDNDGIIDVDEDAFGSDIDGDGIINSFDLDSDADGISDLLESGQDAAVVDTNGDGELDDMDQADEAANNDSNGNGLSDAIEAVMGNGQGVVPVNSDRNGPPSGVASINLCADSDISVGLYDSGEIGAPGLLSGGALNDAPGFCVHRIPKPDWTSTTIEQFREFDVLWIGADACDRGDASDFDEAVASRSVWEKAIDTTKLMVLGGDYDYHYNRDDASSRAITEAVVTEMGRGPLPGLVLQAGCYSYFGGQWLHRLGGSFSGLGHYGPDSGNPTAVYDGHEFNARYGFRVPDYAFSSACHGGLTLTPGSPIQDYNLRPLFDFNGAPCFMMSDSSAPPTIFNDAGEDIPDFLDLDSDADGIPDIIEGQPAAGYFPLSRSDGDGDGVDDSWDANSEFGGEFAEGGRAVDSDGDGVADFRDTDSNNDGVRDDSGRPLAGTDNNGDGIDDAINASYADPDGDLR